MPQYRVELHASAERDLNRLDPQLHARVADRIESLAADPRPNGSLTLSGFELYRIRVGDHRIVYEIDRGENRVVVHRVRHRREVYRKL